MEFEIISEITAIDQIAVNRSIREVARLKKLYGVGRWRKLKGIAKVRFANGMTCTAEIHWYEAHGIGRKEFKVKHILEE